jgi:hypothetical protein
MHGLPTEESRPKQTKRPDDGEKTRKNPVDRTSELPDCTLEQLGLRCNTETTVMKRILHFPLSG